MSSGFKNPRPKDGWMGLWLKPCTRVHCNKFVNWSTPSHSILKNSHFSRTTVNCAYEAWDCASSSVDLSVSGVCYVGHEKPSICTQTRKSFSENCVWETFGKFMCRPVVSFTASQACGINDLNMHTFCFIFILANGISVTKYKGMGDFIILLLCTIIFA